MLKVANEGELKSVDPIGDRLAESPAEPRTGWVTSSRGESGRAGAERDCPPEKDLS